MRSPHQQPPQTARIAAEWLHSTGAQYGVLCQETAYPALSDVSPSHIVRHCGPCVIHVEAFDLALAAELAEHNSQPSSGGGTSAGDRHSAEEQFVRSFAQWLAALHAEIASVTASELHNQSAVRQEHGVAVVVSSMHSQLWQPSTLHSFPSVLTVGAALSARQVAALVEQRFTSTVDPAVEAAVIQRIAECGQGYGAARAVLQEVGLTAMKRQHLPEWAAQCGLSDRLFLPLANSRCGADSGIERIDDGTSTPQLLDVSTTAALVPCVGAAGASHGSSGKYATSIAPVHWSDIGGLDRYASQGTHILHVLGQQK